MQQEITLQLQQVLNLQGQDIPADANLIEFGLHSLAIMQLVNGFQQQYGLVLNYVDFASLPTIADWVGLLTAAQ
jgi:aryl carrier-like protein